MSGYSIHATSAAGVDAGAGAELADHVRPRAGVKRDFGLSARVSARLAVGVAVVFGAVLRVWPRPALWLDEAQSVAFAREPFGTIPGALRQDGAPPLYYLLLRAWANVFGTGTTAVRALSVVLSLLALPMLGLLAHRLWGSRACAAVLVLVSTSSFAIRYASETRMYSLVTLEVAAGLWFVVRWLDGRRLRTLAGVALSTAALLYTHYWGLYLVVTVLAVLTAAAARTIVGPAGRRSSEDRRAVWPIVAAIVTGCLLWLPWLPSFRFQSRHTATPWAQPARLGDIVMATGLRTGWGAVARSAVVIVLAGAVLGAVLRWRPRTELVGGPQEGLSISGRTERPRLFLPLLAVTIGCPLVAVAGGAISNSAYTVRYTAVVFPVAILLVGGACALIRPARIGTVLIVAAAVLSAGVAIHEIGIPRTTAARVAERLRPLVQPGDVVVYCPDQLAPAMSRVLAGDTAFSGVHQEVYPDGSPSRVDWRDYRERYESADPVGFVARYETIAAGHAIWLIWSGTYPPTQLACTALFDQLRATRSHAQLIVPDDPSISDHESLWRFV